MFLDPVAHAVCVLVTIPALVIVIEWGARRMGRVDIERGSNLRRGLYAMLLLVYLVAFALPIRYEVYWLVTFLVLTPLLLGSLVAAVGRKAR